MLTDPSVRRDGFVVRAGVRVHYQVFGEGRRTVLLLPSWSVVHSGLWARQVPYLAGRYTVIALDGRGNGASDRPTGPDAYSDWEFAADALAVLDSVGVEDAAVVSMSGGAASGLILAANSPERSAPRSSSRPDSRSHPRTRIVRQPVHSSMSLNPAMTVG